MKKNIIIIFCFLWVDLMCAVAEKQSVEASNNYFNMPSINFDFQGLQTYLTSNVFGVFQKGMDFGLQRSLNRFKKSIRDEYPKQKQQDFFVRQGTDLSAAEINFINNRMPKVNQALEQNFGMNRPLKIAFCASGGGNRAMLVTLGAYLGMQDIGLFDALLYSAGVSGSTWTIAPWSYLYATQNMSISDFKDQLIGRLDQYVGVVKKMALPMNVDESQKNKISQKITQRFAFDQPISAIDVYGCLIGNYTLLPVGDNRLDVTWSSIASQVEQGDMPMPIGASVMVKGRPSVKDVNEYYWFEVSPFEVGSDQLSAYVPLQAFGSKFNQGKTVKGYKGHAYEYPLCFFQGVFGSAFAASLNEVIDLAVKSVTIKFMEQRIVMPIDIWIKNITPDVIAKHRVFAAKVANYMYGLPSHPLNLVEELRLCDGAMNFNFPLPLVMRPARDVDLIILCDSCNDLSEMKKAELHFQRNNIKFPDISSLDQKTFGSKILTVLNDPRSKDYDTKTVTILYCPFIKNEGFSKLFDPVNCILNGVCNTFNFRYKKKQAEEVVDLVRYNFNSLKNEIQQVMLALNNRKNINKIEEILAV